MYFFFLLLLFSCNQYNYSVGKGLSYSLLLPFIPNNSIKLSIFRTVVWWTVRALKWCIMLCVLLWLRLAMKTFFQANLFLYLRFFFQLQFFFRALYFVIYVWVSALFFFVSHDMTFNSNDNDISEWIVKGSKFNSEIVINKNTYSVKPMLPKYKSVLLA